MRSIEDFKVRGKRVLMRCDFNVGLDELGQVVDDFRIERTIPSIRYLQKKGAKIILMSHLGDPEPRFQKEFSLAAVQEKLVELLDASVTKARDCLGSEIERWINQMAEGEILLLENLRFRAGEKKNDPIFGKNLARTGDVFINEAFGASHREHASIVQIPEFLPSGIGLCFRQELEALDKIFKKPKRPVVGIVGGAKASSKIEPLPQLLKKADFLLLGGQIANAILRAKGLSMSFFPNDGIVKTVKGLELTHPRLYLPVDVVAVLDGVYSRKTGVALVRKEEQIFDIGPETVKLFGQILRGCRTVFWAGPLGRIEKKEFSIGSLGVARALVRSKAFSVIGGDQTTTFFRKNNLDQKVSRLCTGGTAMLQYLSQGTLAGIEAIKKSEKESP